MKASYTASLLEAWKFNQMASLTMIPFGLFKYRPITAPSLLLEPSINKSHPPLPLLRPAKTDPQLMVYIRGGNLRGLPIFRSSRLVLNVKVLKLIDVLLFLPIMSGLERITLRG